MRLDLLLRAARWRNLANTVPDENVRSLILREVKRLEEESRRQEQALSVGTTNLPWGEHDKIRSDLNQKTEIIKDMPAVVKR
jgi:hypothetical protein